MKKILLILCMICFAFMASAQSELKVFTEWMSTDGSQNFFFKNVTQTDASGNVYVAGSTLNDSNNYDILVAKYNSSGVLQWIEQYNGAGNGHDMATGLHIDGSSNVYITGTITTATNIDAVTIKYNSGGVQQWLSTYNGTGSGYDCGADITMDGSGNVYITGSTYNASGNYDIITIKYNSSGAQQWATPYDYSAHLNDAGVKIGLDAMGNAVISAVVQSNSTTYIYGVLKFNCGSGALVSGTISGNYSTGIELINDMVQDSSGNIYLAGAVPVSGQGYNYDIIKLNANLGLVWEHTYNGGSSLDDIATAIKVDEWGNVYVSGYSSTVSEGKNIITLKYNSSGTLQWSRTYNDTLNKDDKANAMAMDASGSIYITGSVSTEADSTDYFTIKYNSAGDIIWTIQSDGNAHLNDEANNIAIDTSGDIIVTGGSATATGSYEYLTIKYVEKQVITPTDYNSEEPFNSFSYFSNKGQIINTSDSLVPDIKFYTTNSSPAFYIRDNSYSFVFAHGDAIDSTADTLQRIDVSFTKTNSIAKTYPMEERRDYLNYFLPQCPDGITKVHANQRLITTDLYPNIDLMYSSNQDGIKQYFIIKPEASPGDIEMLFEGISSSSIDGTTGELIIISDIGSITFDKPTAYLIDSNNVIDSITNWECTWGDNGANTYIFKYDTYDNTKVLVIQMDRGHSTQQLITNANLDWSTYYGGNLEDEFLDVETDGNSNTYVTGYTRSSNFPRYNAIQTLLSGTQDAIIIKFDYNGLRIFATLYGGSSIESGNSIIADNATGNIYVVGLTLSSNLPQATTQPAGAYVATYQGSTEAFILELNSTGNTIKWSTYYGGSNLENFQSIDDDNLGNIYIVGQGSVNTTPLLNVTGAYNNSTIGDGLITKFTKLGVRLWATLYVADYGYVKRIKTDNNNNFYIIGDITHTNMPTSGDYADATLGGPKDAFVAKFNTANNIDWATYLGGSGSETGNALAIYTGGAKSAPPGIYVTGGTSSGNFPVVGSYYSNQLNGATNTYVSKFLSNGNLVWSTYHGNCATGYYDEGFDIVNHDDEVIVTGSTHGINPLQLTGAYYQNTISNPTAASDAYLLSFNCNDQSRRWATYFGGKRTEVGRAITVDPLERLYLVGQTASLTTDPPPLPLVQLSGAYWQSTNAGAGNFDAFISRFVLSQVITDIDEENYAPGLNVYPNPTNGLIFISAEIVKSDNIVISISNILGQKLMELNGDHVSGSFKKQIDISNYSSGIYVINVSVSGKQYFNKIIKQ